MRAAGLAPGAGSAPTQADAHQSRISALVVSKALDQLRAWAIDPDPILEDIGLDQVQLADADARVPLWAFTSMLELAAQKASAPRLGLQLAAALGPDAWGRSAI